MPFPCHLVAVGTGFAQGSCEGHAGDLPDKPRLVKAHEGACGRAHDERMATMSLIEFSSFVNDLATHSGRAILPFFRTALSVGDKSTGADFDPVTEADRAGESVMRHMIKQHFPGHGIIGEEFGAENGEAEYVWVLDPIDG